MSDFMRPLIWMGSSKTDLDKMPHGIKSDFGYALFLSQIGLKHADAKPLKGFGGAGVLEIVESDADGTYRAVYTVRLKKAVYVLHCYQKKSTHGIKTRDSDIALIKARLRDAEDLDSMP